jgi:hypothetical protein
MKIHDLATTTSMYMDCSEHMTCTVIFKANNDLMRISIVILAL